MAVYDDLIAEASRTYNIPENQIRALIGQESGGQQFAKSAKGAQGLMQVMPDTYNELRTKHKLGYDPYEPRNNIQAGTAYYRQMLDQFGGDPKSALAAYNMGPNAFSEYKAGRRSMPAETQKYLAALAPKFAFENIDHRKPNGPPVPLSPGAQKDIAALTPSFRDENVQGLLQTQTAPRGGLLAELLADDSDPAPSRAEYLTTGALKGIAPLMGAQPTRVGFGQVLAALGGGMQAGKAGYEAALTGRRDNVLKRALIASEISKNMRDGKVGGTDDMQEYNFAVQSGAFKGSFPDWLKQVKGNKDGDGRTTDMKEYEYAKANGQFSGTFPEWQKAKKEEDKGPGPFYGTGAEVQAANQLVKAGMPIEQVSNWLLTKPAVGPNGAIDLFNPGNVYGMPQPPAGGAGVPPAVPPAGGPPAAVPPAGQPVVPQIVPPQAAVPQPPGAVPPGPPQQAGSRVRQPDMSPADKAMIDESKKSVIASASALDALKQAKTLSGQAYEGPLAGIMKFGSRVTGVGAEAGAATQQFDSIMTEQALGTLKATFGSAPTEGERKILLEMQAASSMSTEERDALLDRAEKAVQNRLKIESDKIAAIQNGTYYSTPQSIPASPDPAPAATPPAGSKPITSKYGLTKGGG